MTDGRRRVLWLTDEPPHRGLGGGNIRQAHLVTGLAQRCDVHLVIMGGPPDDDVAAAVDRVTLLDDPGLPERSGALARRLQHLWLALGARGPREVALAARRRRRLRPLLDELEPTVDVVVACHPSLAAARPARPSARWVAQIHHVASLQATHEQQVAAGRRQRWLWEREEAKARRWERDLLDDFDLVVLVSEDDRRAVAGAGSGDRVLVVPNGVDTSRYRPTPLPAEPRVLLAGSFQYGPNIDGARWFCAEVLPAVRRAVPGTVLALAGRSPAAEVRALADEPGIELHPDVASMVPWFEWSRLTVVPLRVGAGSRLKALESMAAGRPVVGTPIGLAGLAARDGVEVHVAADAVAMAGAVATLLQDDEQAASTAAAGRRFVEEHHDWSAIAAGLADQIVDLAGTRR